MAIMYMYTLLKSNLTDSQLGFRIIEISLMIRLLGWGHAELSALLAVSRPPATLDIDTESEGEKSEEECPL